VGIFHVAALPDLRLCFNRNVFLRKSLLFTGIRCPKPLYLAKLHLDLIHVNFSLLRLSTIQLVKLLKSDVLCHRLLQRQERVLEQVLVDFTLLDF